jgi:acyl-CoA synthetase (NDP forming)
MAVDTARITQALNPRNVAVIGDKGPAYQWLNSMKTFQGKVFSVQLDPKEIPGIEAMGVPNFSSMVDIPDDVDYAVIAVPRRVAPIVLKDCIAKGVAGVGMFTSGFAESGSEEGTALQETITQMARDSGLVLLGPNCMGLYNPKLGVRFGADQPTGDDGGVTVISQSGGHAGGLASTAYANGVELRVVVSFGNGVVLENEDWLEYFAQDDGTKIIAMYIEGIRDGRSFFRRLREVTKIKPVLVWKGGQTEAGKRATSSHTGSIGESMDTWDAVIRQAGAIRADNLEDASDTLKALASLPPFTGLNAGLTGGTGGQSVSMTDAFSKAGLGVPLLTQDSLDRLGEIMQVVGASYYNPIDIGGINREHFGTILDIWAHDSNVDSLMMQFSPQVFRRSPEAAEEQIGEYIGLKATVGKPMVAVLHSTNPYADSEAVHTMDGWLRAAGIPTFPTYERAARSLRKVADYHRFHAGIE